MRKEKTKLYEVEDVRKILRIGRSTAYQLVSDAYKNQEPFKVLKIGKVYRIPKKSFDQWVDGGSE